MLLHIFIKTVVLYILIIISYRVMGKKEVGKLSTIDLIVSVLIIELAAIAIEEPSRNLWYTIFPIILLVGIQVSIGFLSIKSDRLRHFIDGKPAVIIKKGKLSFSMMAKMRYSLDDLMVQLREHEIKSIEEVDYAILENNGKLSIFRNSKDYPMPFIIDSKVQYGVLQEIHKSREWLDTILEKRNIRLEDIFYAFYTEKKTFIITRKDLL